MITKPYIKVIFEKISTAAGYGYAVYMFIYQTGTPNAWTQIGFKVYECHYNSPSTKRPDSISISPEKFRRWYNAYGQYKEINREISWKSYNTLSKSSWQNLKFRLR